jgi:4-alpha-glucanotransferase
VSEYPTVQPPPSPRAWGVVPRYTRTDGSRRRPPRATVAAVLAAMGAVDRGDGPPEEEGIGPLVVIAGAAVELAGDAEVELEEGGARPCRGRLPVDLPLGYHRLHGQGRTRPLIVTPPRCHPGTELHGFGFTVQLASARSRESWGIGDLRDLEALGGWARSRGASTLVVSPLHASLPIPPVEPSPYYPASRLFLNPLHLRPEPEDDPEVRSLAAAARRLDAERRIDRDHVATLKTAALERLFAITPEAAAAAERALGERAHLRDVALFSALAERHGKDWRDWPRRLATRDPAALQAAEAELAPRVRFHAWVQAELDRQLESAGRTLPLVADLAVGVHPGGADAWLFQDVLAPGVSVGAPPDSFNPLGQDWGLPAFDPWKLRAAAYRPLVDTLRASLRHAGGLRIDHVMGLERLWWIPAGAGPAEGAYVRYPADDLLGIVALESVRHRAVVVGEDLGTVPRGLHTRLRRRGLLGYVLLLFDDRPPERWPRRRVAAVTTHDLPSVAGLWDGSDLAARRRSGLPADPEETRVLRKRLARGGLPLDADVETAIVHAYRALGRSPCLLVMASLEDTAAVRERPNQPGLRTPTNWSLALPMPLEELTAGPLTQAVVDGLRRDGSLKVTLGPWYS